MKKIGLILAGCLAFTGILGAHAEDIGDVARAAARRVSNAQTRQTATNSTNSRSVNSASHSGTNVRGRNNTTSQRTAGVVERTTTSVPRTTGNVVSRSTAGTVSARTPTTVARTTTETATRSGTRTASTRTRTVARAASSNTVTREDILNRDYSKCKTVFFDCMDEFCANKDAQLKRCACSSRIHEFDSVKKQLEAVEDKMLKFNQRLLTVSMEKEDAAALSVATEGENAYLASTDKSDSKKTLDAIAKKLNTSFDSSNFNTDLNVLSWSLNADSAFDSVDSMLGASTTSKSGTALYSAALPVCREMAAEVCSDSDIALAEGGYQAIIEQDCNTVAKTYKTQTEQARSKVLEGGALLDMSRLDIYQKRNSDDILTCKKKMLDMLTNSTVCGDDLGKCLDVTGQYIDPSTGEAFLTPDLVNLGNLLKRPTDNYTWATVPGNSTFVSFLNSKKKFLEPAMEQCQNIADAVWNSFIDDALSQIKLAQDKKLETVRQSCTTLSTQCLSNATQSITDFDARALSTFGVSADKTASAMCADVLNSCTALLEMNGVGTDWTAGVTEIATTTTYETMMQTCRQVGQACIIQVCTSSSGNFGLCESIANSTNRKTIINQTACWDQVKDCIRNVGETGIDNIITQLSTQNNDISTGMDLNFYKSMYGSIYTIIRLNDATGTCTNSNETNDPNCIYDICSNECDGSSLFECRICRLAENIWGNCEVPPNSALIETTSHNRIKKANTDTLLYWFATNTGTAANNVLDSCRDTTCPVGFVKGNDGTCISYSGSCWKSANSPTRVNTCPSTNDQITPVSGSSCQCCDHGKDTNGHCCAAASIQDDQTKYCSFNGQRDQVIATYTDENNIQHALICIGTMDPDANNPTCNGTFINVTMDSSNGWHYNAPNDAGFVLEQFIADTSNATNGMVCTYDASNQTWNSGLDVCSTNGLEHWTITFNEQ